MYVVHIIAEFLSKIGYIFLLIGHVPWLETAAVVWHVSTRAVKAGSTATKLYRHAPSATRVAAASRGTSTGRYSKTAAYTVHTCTVGTLASLGLAQRPLY